MDGIESKLVELSNIVRGISGEADRPKTAFELLGKARYEDAWQAYLAYFIDPNQPHGLGSRFLIQFFDVLENQDMVAFSPSGAGLTSKETIQVVPERQSEGDNRPDIVITSGEEWFLCLELKVHSQEGSGETAQTVRYANDPMIVPDGTDTYETGDYLYIRPTSTPTSSSDRFSDINWTDMQSIVDNTITDVSGRVSARTLAQLSDFSTLIESQLNMTSLDEDTKKRKNLYFDYRNEINEVQNAVRPFVKKVLQQNWGAKLEEEYSPSNAEVFDWRYRAMGRGYGQIRIPRWETAKSGSEKLDIHWEHTPTEDDFKKGQLRFTLELEEPNRSTMSDSSGERYHQFREDVVNELDQAVPTASELRCSEYNIEPSQSQKKLIRFIYEFQPGDEDGYYEGLQFALEDTESVTELVTEKLDATDYTEYPAE